MVDKKECGREEMKYLLGDEGYLARISKKIKKAEGESLGAYFIQKNDLGIFKEELLGINDGDYFEQALELLFLKKSFKMKPVDIEKAFCKEIDFPQDLAEVRQKIKS